MKPLLSPDFFDTRLAHWLALPAGALLSLAFAPVGWWPLAILCPAWLFLTWLNTTPRLAAKSGFLFTVGLFLAGTYWLYNTIHEVGHAPAWIAIFLMFGMVAILGSYTAGLGYALARWLPARKADGTFVASLLHLLLVFPAAYTVLEWFRGWFLSGFPWFALGYSQTDSPLAGFAPIAGVYGISLFVAISAGALVAIVFADNRARIVSAAVLVAVWVVGGLLWHREWTAPIGRPITVAIVQGAVPQDVKWSVEYRDSTLALYRDLSWPHLGKDIILWPESALPDMPDQLRSYVSYMWSAARARGSALITGMLRYGDDENDIRNGLLALDKDAQWYDKRRLVPFGEVFPVPSFIRSWMRLQNLPYTDLTPGARHQPALDAAGNKIGATICYEDAYGAEQLEVLKEATLLVNVTNDAWFGDTTAAPQHLQISRMRVMEAQRPLLRAANDGISALILANGTVEKTLPRFKPDVLTGVVQPRTGLTPYARVGNWPVIGTSALILAVVGFFAFRSRRNRGA
ncbi:apolipoprotein N-acyltransferase [Povalibacter uvarum]|uniref:Apolipoprotein N-acyltransferase n=1 Tax=Povalibacter uvarum TaxID=732238 RepID=A0A841HQB1_9GAMM|nr:apolipoprotein N-acyltransferase [Povalibacter uvarum]MBB6094095.1 apolipoprotein N-acyltransferase [Povalibacter uvarum]